MPDRHGRTALNTFHETSFVCRFNLLSAIDSSIDSAYILDDFVVIYPRPFVFSISRIRALLLLWPWYRLPQPRGQSTDFNQSQRLFHPITSLSCLFEYDIQKLACL